MQIRLRLLPTSLALPLAQSLKEAAWQVV